ncbi:MAG: acetoin utilization protein AcuC [Betaproteobacteria bacterium]|jgi:acetoin utilization protein AcuC|nr:acetoin utilization protein AcuC [Betaproteobacteria bacterium]MDH4293544.1 acetoin utilization protein AcuC [Betaproteobacteria bacterium]MDH5342201.1 acetoin utilization protein AcuC [Betaproteobacteria bacterium]
MKQEVALYVDEGLGSYGFPDGHPWGTDRQDAFWKEATRQKLDKAAVLRGSRAATVDEIERFHGDQHVQRVHQLSDRGYGSIDAGDTPAFPGVFEASAHVVGAALDGLQQVMTGEVLRTFQPIGGLHHAARNNAAGFCVFNDCGVVIDTLRSQYGIKRVAYVDIDVHHGDGLYYPYESDPDLIYADIHEDGRFLYPGTGADTERGKGPGLGLKLNIPMQPASGDPQFMAAWERVEAHLRQHKPEFIVFQAGADSIAGDPLAHLQYTPAAHAHAAQRLCVLANEMCQGRIMGFGGGGYNRNNLALGWCGVLNAFIHGSEK